MRRIVRGLIVIDVFVHKFLFAFVEDLDKVISFFCIFIEVSVPNRQFLLLNFFFDLVWLMLLNRGLHFPILLLCGVVREVNQKLPLLVNLHQLILVLRHHRLLHFLQRHKCFPVFSIFLVLLERPDTYHLTHQVMNRLILLSADSGGGHAVCDGIPVLLVRYLPSYFLVHFYDLLYIGLEVRLAEEKGLK